jgi:hypothetical protein
MFISAIDVYTCIYDVYTRTDFMNKCRHPRLIEKNAEGKNKLHNSDKYKYFGTN